MSWDLISQFVEQSFGAMWLQGVLFWEWHSTTSEETDSAFDRPYGVKETDSTWYHVIKPSSQALADVVADRHQRGMTVPGCTPSQS